MSMHDDDDLVNSNGTTIKWCFVSFLFNSSRNCCWQLFSFLRIWATYYIVVVVFQMLRILLLALLQILFFIFSSSFILLLLVFQFSVVWSRPSPGKNSERQKKWNVSFSKLFFLLPFYFPTLSFYLVKCLLSIKEWTQRMFLLKWTGVCYMLSVTLVFLLAELCSLFCHHHTQCQWWWHCWKLEESEAKWGKEKVDMTVFIFLSDVLILFSIPKIFWKLVNSSSCSSSNTQ